MTIRMRCGWVPGWTSTQAELSWLSPRSSTDSATRLVFHPTQLMSTFKYKRHLCYYLIHPLHHLDYHLDHHLDYHPDYHPDHQWTLQPVTVTRSSPWLPSRMHGSCLPTPSPICYQIPSSIFLRYNLVVPSSSSIWYMMLTAGGEGSGDQVCVVPLQQRGLFLIFTISIFFNIYNHRFTRIMWGFSHVSSLITSR